MASGNGGVGVGGNCGESESSDSLRTFGAVLKALRDEARLTQEQFAPLVQYSAAYIAKIEQYSGEKVTYAGDSVSAGAATVKTRFTTSKGADVPIDYRMLAKGDRWLVYDVNIEGISLIGNYRTQFNKIIQTSSYQDLVTKMKTRQTDFAAPAAKPKS